MTKTTVSDDDRTVQGISYRFMYRR